MLGNSKNAMKIAIRTLVSNSKNTSVISNGLAEKPSPHLVKQDFIGPPDQTSNLRPFVRCIPKDETALQARLRHKRIETESWNQEFWTRHNKRFYDKKTEFQQLHRLADNNEISADKMSTFYKSFLDEHKRIHFLYNISWYQKNFELLALALLVQLESILPKKRKFTEVK